MHARCTHTHKVKHAHTKLNTHTHTKLNTHAHTHTNTHTHTHTKLNTHTHPCRHQSRPKDYKGEGGEDDEVINSHI